MTKLLSETFSSADINAATAILLTIQHRHVMAQSDYNLTSARGACILLSKGDIAELQVYVDAAKIDFRDVVMWAMAESSE